MFLPRQPDVIVPKVPLLISRSVPLPSSFLDGATPPPLAFLGGLAARAGGTNGTMTARFEKSIMSLVAPWFRDQDSLALGL
jgi:hypothetical protein